MFNHAVTGLTQYDEGVVVTATDALTSRTTQFSGQYLCGCDGGHSAVRKLSGTSFDGFTWPVQLISTNVVGYLFEEYESDSTDYIIDKSSFAYLGTISKRLNMWRVTFGVKQGLSEDEIEEAVHEAYKKLFPRPKLMGPLQRSEYKLP